VWPNYNSDSVHSFRLYIDSLGAALSLASLPLVFDGTLCSRLHDPVLGGLLLVN
jgi:hypothetical protein